MILPNKHLLSQDSLIGIGGMIMIRIGDSGTTVSRLWEQVRSIREVGTYERFILSLDTLFMLGLLDFENGLLVKKEPEK